jgi:hypothetical protein
MPRRNTRRINKQPKLKNNQIVKTAFSFEASAGDFTSYMDLITNPSNLTPGNLTGYVETIGRFSIDCTFEGALTLENVALFVMYIPEGYPVGTSAGDNYDVLNQHPEWIMAYKYLGSASDSANSTTRQGFQPTRIRSRVRRNLMTGDRIVLLVTGTNTASSSTTGTIWAYLKFASRIN